MRLGIDVRPLQGPNSNRGIGRCIKYLLRGLREQASAVEPILFVRAALPVPIEVQQYRVIPVETPPILPYKRFFRFGVVRQIYHRQMHAQHRTAFREAVQEQRLDVLYLPNIVEHDYFTDANGVCPTVATLYDLIPLVLAKDYIDTWMKSNQELYRRQIQGYPKISMLTVISDASSEDAIRLLGVERDRIRTIPCALPTDGISEWWDTKRQEETRTRYGLKTPYFLYCSGSGPNKNLERQIDAYGAYVQRNVAAIPFVIAGKWLPEDQKKLEERAQGQNIPPDKLRFLGFVADNDLWLLLAAATALITVSLYEGFGLPAAEAMAVGTPVLAANTSSYPEVLGDAGILVPPEDTGAIADGFERLANDEPLRRQMSERGYARFMQCFTLERQTEAYLKLFTQVARGETVSG